MRQLKAFVFYTFILIFIATFASNVHSIGDNSLDNFTSTTMSSEWTIIDTVGSAANSLTNNPGHLQIIIPANKTYNCRDNINTCYRIMKTMQNGDTTYETKIDSTTINQRYQSYGIILYQDNQNYLTYELWAQGNTIRPVIWKISGGITTAIIGSVIPAATNNYLKITKSGAIFTTYYSTDGNNWNTTSIYNTALTINNAGITINSYGNNQGITTNFDYMKIGNPQIVAQNFTLNVLKSGTGQGTLTSNPAGIDCGATCTSIYNSGQSVTLTATPAANSTFTAWSGACSGTGSCSFNMTQNQTVNAQFTSNTVNQTDSLAPNLTITSPTNNQVFNVTNITITGISIDNIAVSYVQVKINAGAWKNATGTTTWNTTAILTAGTNTIQAQAFDLSNNPSVIKTINVTYNIPVIQNYTLNITKSGTGQGTVTSNTGGINCGATCGAKYQSGTIVILTATPTNSSYQFAGWSGACSGASTCTLTMNSNQTANAIFNILSNSSSGPVLWVYRDALYPAWRDSTYGATSDYANTERIYAGSASIKTSTTTGALSIDANTGTVSLVGYGYLQFKIYSTTAFTIYAQLQRYAPSAIGGVGTAILANQWNTVTIPLSSYNIAAPVSTDRIYLFDAIGTARTFYIDNLAFTNTSTPPVVDVIPPTVTITNPTDGTLLSNSVTLQATASDNEQMNTVQYKIDGSFVGSPISSAPYSYTLDTHILSNAAHIIIANATDVSGNTAESAGVSVTVNNPDNTPPILSVSYGPSNPQPNQPISFTADASDSNGISIISLKVNGVVTTCNNVNTCTYTKSSGFANNTNVTYSANATDNSAARNFVSTQSSIIIRDNSISTGSFKFVSAYYPTFASIITPYDINYDGITTLVHFDPTANTLDASPYFAAQAELGQGTQQADLLSVAHNHNPRIDVVLSTGVVSTPLSNIAANSAALGEYADGFVNYAHTHGYDGVEVDWESGVTSQGWINLMTALRTRLDTWNPKGKLVVAAANIPGWYDANTANTKVDQFNIMMYDMEYICNNLCNFHDGSYRDIFGFIAPLHRPGTNYPILHDWQATYDGGGYDASNNWLDPRDGPRKFIQMGYNASKLSIGIPFYTKIYTSPNPVGPGTATVGSSWYRWGTQRGVQDAIAHGGVEQYDATVEQPYIAGSSSTTFGSWWDFSIDVSNGDHYYYITYDNPRSTTAKVNWAAQQGIGGIMIYELYSDYLPNAPAGQKTPLLNAAITAIKNS